jgi:hypothetical protein
MTQVGSVKVTSILLSQWIPQTDMELKAAVLEMATDIRTRAVVLAPVETCNLKNSGVIEPIAGGYKVKFGSSRVPYARRRHFENFKNPQTTHYLEKAGDSVKKGNLIKYFRGTK